MTPTQYDSTTVEAMDMAWQRYHISLRDGGPVYAETNLKHMIVEPWNAWSSLLLIVPAVYWAIRLRNRYRDYPFISFCIPLLVLGGLGSTLFHAFRASSWLLYMDVLPTAILTLSLGFYFWKNVTGRWWIGIGVLAFSVLCRVWVHTVFAKHTAINLGYAITGTVIFVPLLWMLFKTHFQKSPAILLAIGFFLLSLFFRETDAWENQVLPMGTHFLWHTFSAAGAFYLAKYLYFLESGLAEKKQMGLKKTV